MRALSLMYHDVVPKGAPDGSGFANPWANYYKLEESLFRSHMDALAASASGAAVTVLERADFAADPWPVFLTFDDGGISAQTPIAEWLEARGWRGHFFVTTDWIGKSGFLDESGLRELHRRGHVIGSHSCSHPARMASCTREQLTREWKESRRRLEAILGAPVRSASVPGGDYSRAVAETASDEGFAFLFTSEPRVVPQRVGGCLVLGRYIMVATTRASEVSALADEDVWPRLRQSLSWNVRKVAKFVGGPLYLKVRRALKPPPPRTDQR